MVDPAKLPITVLGGWLGAGKTTMVNRILAATTERLAIIVNDVGDVNIDAGFLRENAGDDESVIELTNGCVCCKVGDDLQSTIHQLARRTPAPDRVILEASGVADLFPITTYLEHPNVAIDAVIALADPDNFAYRSSGPPYGSLMRAQLSGADLVVATKLDLLDTSEHEAALDGLREFTKARVIPASADPNWINTVILGTHANESGSDAHAAGAPVATTTWRPSGPVDAIGLRSALRRSGLLRAKGSLATEEEAVRVHLAGGRVSIDPLSTDVAPINALVLIGDSTDQLNDVVSTMDATVL